MATIAPIPYTKIDNPTRPVMNSFTYVRSEADRV
jgi:hypothetical protein